MNISLTAAVMLLLLLPISTAHAEFYYWTDQKGVGYATDDISKVPEAYRSQALSKKVFDEEKTDTPRNERGQRQLNPAAPEKKAERARFGTEPTDQNGRGEAYWRGRAEYLRNRLEDLQDQYDSLCATERACENQPYNPALGKRPDCSRFGAYKERQQKEIERTRRKLEVDLPDEASKAGAYPGWLR